MRIKNSQVRPRASSWRNLSARVLDASYWCLYALPHLLNYLVHALPRKVELVRNKTERFSSAVKFQNLGVSVGIRLRAWSQRAPLPSWDLFKFLNSFDGELSLAASLPKVTNPGAQWKGGIIDVLDMRGRNSAMSFARGELIDGCNGEVETRDVVHVENNNIKSNIN